ncbi:MAG: lipopolysaccharide biosynthesis protein [Peptococcaceae bacterium]|nr:lipopolysaccharide biosynthesis protein [Peptococcaceae bacterium]
MPKMYSYICKELLTSLVQNFYRVKSDPFYANAFFLMFNSLINSITGFIFWNIMAWTYTPLEVGIGSALVAASMLIATGANTGLGIGLIRFLPEEEEKKVYLINSAFTLAGLTAIIASIIYLGGADYWSPDLSFIKKDEWMVFFFILFAAANTLSILTDQSMIAGRSAHFVFGKNAITGILKIPLPVLLFTNLKGYGIFAGTGAAALAGILISWFKFLPAIYKGYLPGIEWPGSVMRKILPYSFYNYMANLMNSLPGLVYPLMTIKVLGPEQNAYFYVAWMMAMVLSVIPGGLAQSLLTEGSYNQRKLGKNARRSLTLAFATAVPAVGLTIVLSSWLLDFFGPGYAEHGSAVVRFLALSIIPQSINNCFITINQVRKEMHLIIAQTTIMAAISLGLGYWLLTRLGLPGLGMAYTLAHLIVALAVLYPLWQAVKDNSRRIADVPGDAGADP